MEVTREDTPRAAAAYQRRPADYYHRRDTFREPERCSRRLTPRWDLRDGRDETD